MVRHVCGFGRLMKIRAGARVRRQLAAIPGAGFQQFGTVDEKADHTAVPVTETEISSATITDLCQSVVATFPFGLGQFTQRITAGRRSTPRQRQLADH
jgi:uncharacterized protein DUF6230